MITFCSKLFGLVFYVYSKIIGRKKKIIESAKLCDC